MHCVAPVKLYQLVKSPGRKRVLLRIERHLPDIPDCILALNSEYFQYLKFLSTGDHKSQLPNVVPAPPCSPKIARHMVRVFYGVPWRVPIDSQARIDFHMN